MLQKNLDPDFVVHELEAGSEGEPLSEKQLWEMLTRTFQSPRYQPPLLPPVASELMALSTGGRVQPEQIVDLLEKDTLLAARVLKLCRSPLYGAGTPLCSLDAAVMHLGLFRLRDAVLEASLRSHVFATSGYSEAVDRVRVHSTAVAHLARTITWFTGFEAEEAFLCGLLHDVGYAAALVALGEVSPGQKLTPVVDLWPALGALHETVGGSVATVWKLPAEIARVLRLHHTMKVGEVVHPVAAVIVLAESLANEQGFGLVPKPRKVAGRDVPSLQFGPHKLDVPTHAQLLHAQDALELGTREVEQVREAATRVLEQLKVT